ncbi:chromosome segregation protein SMC [Clostridium thermobutyricum]|uniref:Chromosome partition protein Smc n=1 Tax=Clostridium thermobutyricum TaxID=29372 RepID=N9XPY1_9CLOT|nr:chromosome segregation protein SMC [Clostridium thermobutyricum]ENZ01763.1 chromosome segregation protein SMC [Clostridium thermobutyricum]
MFLKSLEIRGFKSFADKTELKFKKGVTSVVGPNGSGKSNISDAVRWVLGEQSAKTLRGGKMEDIIFAGTQYRKPVGLAKVSLTLSNDDGQLDTDYNEVTISRRIFRSGETEYLINNNKARLKDITNLFMDTGIGKEGYSLIGQGKIEAILSGRPEERRALLEEAAGIVKYKFRKNEAEKKLSNTEDNLVRIRDILSTFEERIEPLRLEREKALKFRDLSKELKGKEVSLVVHSIKDIDLELKNINDDLRSKEEKLNQKRENLNLKREGLREVEEKLESLEKLTTDKKFRYFKKKEDITKFKSNIQILKERIENLKNEIEKNKLEEYTLLDKIKNFKGEKERLEEEILKSDSLRKEKEEEIDELESKSKGFAKKIKELELELKEIKSEEIKILENNSSISNSIERFKERLKGKSEEKLRLIKEAEEGENLYKINKATVNSLSIKIKSLEEDFKVLNKEIVSKKSELAKLNSEIRNKEAEIRGKNINISKLNANVTLLKDLENQYEGYNRSVKSLMERVDRGDIKEGEIKVLGEVLKIDSEYELAIETTLGGAISNLIVQKESNAKNIINYLKNNKLGRVTLLPLDIIKSNKLNLNKSIESIDGFIGIASDIIEFNERYRKAIEYALGRTIIAKDMDSAFKIAKKTGYKNKIVTLEGEVLNSGGALTGGSIKGKTRNVLGRKREIEDLEKEIYKLKITILDLNKQLEIDESNRKSLDEEILNITDKIHSIKVEMATSKNEYSNIIQEKEKIEKSKEINTYKLSNIDKEIKEIEEKRKEKEELLSKVSQKTSDNKDREVQIEIILNENKEKLEKIKFSLVELKINKATLDENHNNKIREISRNEREYNENTEKVANIKINIKKCFEDIENFKEEIKVSENKIFSNEETVAKLELEFKDDEVKKAILKEEFRKVDTVISELRDVITKDEGELNKVQIQKAKKEMEKETLYKKLNEEIELTFAEAIEISEPIENIDGFKESVQSLKRKISSLGMVNLAAIEEYEEVKEKYEFMSSQEEDLEKSKIELLKVIEEMTEEMRILFRENFKILNKNFNETFRELFKGGSAELILGEGDELTSTVDINVEPPGKKLQNINLMSGGEKVLSAIALLFGILKMKPTPFCILDEIEAALDDANVNRYAEFLSKFSEKIQFIVITHRKGTMEVSDVMYGVTMEEKGVSKVVSVDMKNKEE